MLRATSLVVAVLWALGCGDGASSADPTSGAGASGASVGSGAGSTGAGGSGIGGIGGEAPAPGWYDLAPLPAPLQENAVVALGGEVYVVGGFDQLAQVVDRVEAYDPQSNSWRSAAPLPDERHHVNAAVVDGVIYVLGSLVGLSFTAAGDVWAYDPDADAWTAKAPMPAATERGGSAVGAIGSKIYVVGGLRGGGAVADFSAYDTVADAWETLPPLPAARDHLVSGVVDGVFYAIGGRDGGIETIDGGVFAFDPAVGGWSSVAAMITPRGGAAAATLDDGRIVVLGGEGNLAAATGVFEEVEAYDAIGDVWQTLPAMTKPRHGTGAAVVEGVIFMPGGASKQAFGAVADHQALVPAE